MLCAIPVDLMCGIIVVINAVWYSCDNNVWYSCGNAVWYSCDIGLVVIMWYRACSNPVVIVLW